MTIITLRRRSRRLHGVGGYNVSTYARARVAKRPDEISLKRALTSVWIVFGPTLDYRPRVRFEVVIGENFGVSSSERAAVTRVTRALSDDVQCCTRMTKFTLEIFELHLVMFELENDASWNVAARGPSWFVVLYPFSESRRRV